MVAVLACLILLMWLSISAVLVGVGSFFVGRHAQGASVSELFWTGFAMCVCVIQIIHLIHPINSIVTICIVILGLVGLSGLRGRLFALLQDKSISRLTGANICLGFLAICVAFRSAGSCEHFDTGLYGASAVRWAETYPAVLGLANLHGRFGFNSNVFLFHAMLDQWAWQGRSQHLLSGLLVVALLAWVLPAIMRLVREPGRTASDWFLAILLVPCTSWALNGEIGAINTDLPPTIICLVAFSTLLRGLEASIKGDSMNARSRGLISALLFSLCVTLKLATIVLAATGWIIVIAALLLVEGPSDQRRVGIVRVIGLSALIIVPWLLHGFIQSGYFIYPIPLTSMHVTWKVPVVSANWDAAWIRSWARIPHAALYETQGFAWIRPWFRHFSGNREGFFSPLAISVAGLGAYIFGIAKRGWQTASPWVWFLVPSLGGILFWFLEAPALRFGEAAIWITAATLGTLGQGVCAGCQNLRFSRGAVFALVMVSLWASYPRTLWSARFRPVIYGRTFLDLPSTPVVPRQTESGLLVNVPLGEGQCWRAQLPCTPYFNSSLRLRRPGNMASGFSSTRLADELKAP